jgi:potassium-transporting ATPase KdpC subunit
MKNQAIIALKFLLLMTLITGVIYPLVMTGIVQIAFPSKSNGSLVMKDGKVVGSELIGQKFDSTIYFWSRPSATGYNPVPSGASNYGPTSDTLKKLVNARRLMFATVNSLPPGTAVPKEMVFASGSGLDPHISPEAALMQVDRIAAARHFDKNKKQMLLQTVKMLTEKPQFMFLGEARINVLKLNIELDKLDKDLSVKQ